MIAAENYAKALYLALSETGPKDHDKVLDNLVKVLVENGDIGLYDAIELEYKKLAMDAKGIKEVEVTTAQDVHIKKDLIAYLNKHVGKDVEVKHKIDESLIGGVVIRVDD